MYKNKKMSIRLILFLLFLALPLKNCAKQERHMPRAPLTTPQNTTKPSFSHGLVNGPTNAERIVVTFPMSIGLLYICGLANNIVGVQTNALHINNGNLGTFYSRISPNLAKAVNVGAVASVNLESVLKLNPDLVLTFEQDLLSSALYNLLNKNKIPMFLTEAMNGTVDDWIRAVDSFGIATNKTDKTIPYIKYMNETIETVKSRIATTSLEQRPKVALINTNRGNMILRGNRTRFLYHMLTIAGAQLMAEGEDPADSSACAEILFSFDPEIIIDDSRSDEFYAAAWWSLLKPVKEQKVFRTPQDDKQAWVTNWSQPTYSALGIFWLAKIIHPELFEDIDLKSEHKKFCIMLYGEDLSDLYPF